MKRANNVLWILGTKSGDSEILSNIIPGVCTETVFLLKEKKGTKIKTKQPFFLPFFCDTWTSAL